jgi:hypothetical protein
MSPRVRDFVIEHGTVALTGEVVDEAELRASKESQELLDIMNEYNELIAYLDSPSAAHSNRPASEDKFKEIETKRSTKALRKVAEAPSTTDKALSRPVELEKPNGEKKVAVLSKGPSLKSIVEKEKKKKKGGKNKKAKSSAQHRGGPKSEIQVIFEESSVSKMNADVEMKRQAKKKLALIEEKNKVVRLMDESVNAVTATMHGND